MLTAVKSPQQANIDYVEKFGKKWDDVMATLPEQRGRWLINGSDGVSSNIGGVDLVQWDQRHRSANAIQADMQSMVNQVEGAAISSPSSCRRCRARPAACQCRWW